MKNQQFSQFSRAQRSALGLVLFAAACSAGSTTTGRGGPSGASAGTGGKGGGLSIDPTPTGGGDVGVGSGAWIPDSLPPPWLYYNEGSSRAYKDGKLADNVRNLFAGPNSSVGAPQIVYPLHGAMHAVNEDKITFQWLRGAAANVLFRIDGVGADGKISSFYVPCGAGNDQCTYTMPKSDWLWLAAGYANGIVNFTISGTDGAGGPVATSPVVGAAFSPEPVFGALYYWATGSETLKRAAFGSASAVPYIVPNSAENEFGCVGCHTVSRDGKLISFAVAGHKDSVTASAIQSAPVEKPSAPYVKPKRGKSPFSMELAGANLNDQPIDHFGHTVALSPDGQLSVVNGTSVPPWDASNWSWIELRNTITGATIKRYNVGDAPFGENVLPIHPEFSPDGKSLAVALSTLDPNGCVWSYITCSGPLAVIPVVDGSALGPARVVSINSDPEYFDYYPTWSPDGKWIVFQSARRSVDPSTGKGIDPKSLRNKNGLLRMVRAEGGPYTCPGPDCIELVNGAQYTPADAAADLGKHTTWPKFTPFAQGKGNDKNIMFVSMTSQMDYGFLASGQSQIWMFAIDVSLVGKQDPSFAPVWLPYQAYDDGSLTPYWTETLPCTSDPSGACAGCAGGEKCSVKMDGSCECRSGVK